MDAPLVVIDPLREASSMAKLPLEIVEEIFGRTWVRSLLHAVHKGTECGMVVARFVDLVQPRHNVGHMATAAHLCFCFAYASQPNCV